MSRRFGRRASSGPRRHWRGAHEQLEWDDAKARMRLHYKQRQNRLNWPLVGALSLIAVSVGGFVGIEWAKHDAQPVAAAEVPPVRQLERRRGLSAAEIAAVEAGAKQPVETQTGYVSEIDIALGKGSAASLSGRGTRYFARCHVGGGTNCVVDGDTIWMDGRRIRLLNIDTPETHPPRCDREAWLGEAATVRLQQLLNSGTVTAHRSGERDQDTYGRLLRVIRVDGADVGSVLVNEGLARWYGRGRRSWCP